MNQPQLPVPVVFHNVLVIFKVLSFDFSLQDLEAQLLVLQSHSSRKEEPAIPLLHTLISQVITVAPSPPGPSFYCYDDPGPFHL